MRPYDYYSIMRQSKDKKFLRHKIAISAKEIGIKPTVKLFNTTKKTVKKWYNRWLLLGYEGLGGKSKQPHYSPNATSAYMRKRLVALKKEYKRVGADTIKNIKNLTISSKTIRKIWREENVPSRKRRKKHVTKQNLRAVKKQFMPFTFIVEDTKDLIDIPEYLAQMIIHKLPKVQYSFRDVSSGLLILAFADERSLLNSTLFANYTNSKLIELNVNLSYAMRQTDNGSEYIGSWQAKEPSSYTLAIQNTAQQVHNTIFPGAHRMQSDVETIHNLIEVEFFEIESFSCRQDFFDKVHSYQSFFNLVRTNSYKENKTPWNLILDRIPDANINVAKIPVVDLSLLAKNYVDSITKGGMMCLPLPVFSVTANKPIYNRNREYYHYSAFYDSCSFWKY
jgi:hypothetical protein